MGKRGKSKYENILEEGQQYNSWTITGPIVMDGEAKVHVTCRCGYSAAVSCYAIFKGSSKGCLECDRKKRLGAGNHTWRGFDKIPGSFMQRYKRTALRKNRQWTITPEIVNQVYINQKYKCALTGIPIDFENKNYDIGYTCTASLDRIDSKKGYTPENIQLVHKDVNMMKNHYPQDYFIKMCKLVTNKHSK